MPKILLINISPSLAESLQANSDYQVVRVIAGESISSEPDLPDPRHFDIVIDNRASGRLESGATSTTDGTLYVRPNYLRLLKESRGLVYFIHGQDWGEVRKAEIGAKYVDHKSFPAYVKPRMQPNDPGAEYFHDFMDQFATYIEPTAFQRQAWIKQGVQVPWEEIAAYYVNEYGDPRVFTYRIQNEAPTYLVTPNIQPLEDKLRAVQFLIDKVFPLLKPDAYTDVFVPRPLTKAVQRYKQVQTEFREAVTDLEAQIAAAQAFYAPYKAVIRLLGNDLKDLVSKILGELWGLDVVDLDEGKKEGEPKRSDLLISHGEWRALVEVTGSSGRACRSTDLEAFEDNVNKEEAEIGNVNARLLIFNHLTARSLPDRQGTNAFSADICEDAKRLGFGLMSCFDVFAAVEAAREKQMDTVAFIRLLSQPGHIDLWRPSA